MHGHEDGKLINLKDETMKMRENRRLWAFLLAISFFLLPSFAGNVRLSVDYGRGKSGVEKGEIFYINIDVTNIESAPATPDKVPGAKVLYFERMSHSSSFSNINGQITQSTSSKYVVTLRALDEGKFTFGPVTMDGVKSNTVSYSIGKASAQHGSAASQQAQDADNSSSQTPDSDKPKFIGKGDSNLFLRATVSQGDVYEQQALVYTVKLYTTYDAIKFIGATAAPKFDGFVVEESSDISRSLTMETYNGKSYATAVIARYVIFPQMSGQLKVTGNTYTVSVDQREYYHDPFWGSMSYSTPLQLNVTPNDLVVNVKSLPLPKPADFSGGVGSFKIDSELKGTTFKSNTAASIVYTVSGTGNLKYIQLPDLQALYPSELEVYTPTTDVKAEVGSNNVSGSVRFDYTFMPLEEGNFKIPPVKLVYFNPATGKYETATARGYDINVGKGEASAKSQVNRPRHFFSDLKSVKVNDLRKERVPMVRTFAYWLFYILPVGLFLIAFFSYRGYIRSRADMAVFNMKRADKLARKRLRKANNCMKKSNVQGFYDELLIALWGYMSDKLKMPTSELMRDNIRTVLEEKGVEESVIEGFISLLDKCEFAKYSPEGGKEGMESTYRQAIEEINQVENSFKKGGK
ncbi:MAG: BatD family protein [Muribaculaceae bacterium]|nr:BatD family protein [Muribaculaceae bacterium]